MVRQTPTAEGCMSLLAASIAGLFKDQSDRMESEGALDCRQTHKYIIHVEPRMSSPNRLPLARVSEDRIRSRFRMSA